MTTQRKTQRKSQPTGLPFYIYGRNSKLDGRTAGDNTSIREQERIGRDIAASSGAAGFVAAVGSLVSDRARGARPPVPASRADSGSER